MNGTWLIPFQGRHGSCATKQNFLWKNGNIYIMDNHRAALWCWLQEADKNVPFNLYHIDGHYDCRNIAGVKYIDGLPDISLLTVSEYLGLSASETNNNSYLVITWDNFLSLFIERYKNNINEFYTSTHQVGDKPDILFEEVPPHNLPDFFRQYVVDGTEANWIIDIDLDYFFCSQTEQLKKMFSTSYIEEIFSAISEANDSGRVVAITICLSPECCGGWEQAEELCYLLCKYLKVDFQIPSTC